jgi:NAD(P)-dependent dehydrogenase (short-subunit alcohol dehydrogenase family)
MPRIAAYNRHIYIANNPKSYPELQPNMPSLPVVRVFNSAFSPSYLPVAVIFGGTSGIGQAMAEALARYTKGNAHIILIGRNRPAAESIIASFPKPASTESGWRHEFVACDVPLMKNVHAVTSDLLTRLPKINFLVISSGYLSFRGRNETEEGIDEQLAVRYYSRWKLISDLLPALRQANRGGEASKVMSVLDPLRGTPVDSNDFGLRQKYSGMAAAKASLTYMDMGLEVSGRGSTEHRPGILTIHNPRNFPYAIPTSPSPTYSPGSSEQTSSHRIIGQ